MLRFRSYLTGAALTCAAVSLAQAQEEPQELDAFVSDEIPIEENILPTTRPFNSVYGTNRSILDTPRNVNIVSREQLDAISIKDVRDFSKLTSSSYTKSNFGAPTTPNLRGQEGDLLINGTRRGHSINGNGVPVNFNSVESVNIVKGPAGAIYGTSNYVGGYADLITKRAYFENGGSIEYTYGSFDQHTLNLDANVAISDTVAMRVSYQHKEWEGFWDRWYDNSDTLYVTLAWRPNDKYSLDVMAEYYEGDYTENWGINRVTQDLIDDGLYIPNVGTDAEYAANLIANPAQGFGNFGAIQLDVDNPVSVGRDWKLSAPGDGSEATVFWAQAIQEYEVSDSFKIISNTYFHYKDRYTFSSYHYSELLRDNWSFETRLQFVQEFEPSMFDLVTLNYGARYKYQTIWSANHFFNEPVNYFDMTRDPDTFRVPDSSFAGFNYVDDQAGRGVLDQWYAGQAFDTESTILAPFAQLDIRVDEKFSILLGYTIDFVDTEEGTPRELVASDGSALDYSRSSVDGNLYNANVSLVYKPTESSSVYFTYNEGEHYDADTGGAISGGSLGGDLETQLFELGTNMQVLDSKGYVGAAIFNQKYNVRNQDGSIDGVETDGFEIEFNYQPNRNFFVTVGYSYLHSVRSAGFLATSVAANNVVADGNGDYFYTTPTFPGIDGTQRFEAPGVPPHLLNALVQYTFDNGIGLQANMVYTSEMQVTYDGGIVPGGDAAGTTLIDGPVLDAQIEFDAKIFYEYENWRFEFSVFNVTDEENWDLPNTGYSFGSIVGRPDRNYEFSVRYDW